MTIVVGSISLVFALLCFVVVRQVFRTGFALRQRAEEPGVAGKGGSRSLATDLIASAWIAASVYTLLLICIPSGPLILNDLLVTLIPLITACAALERWRWSRGAMLGMSVVILLDLTCAAVRVGMAENGPVMSAVRLPVLWATVLSGFNGDVAYGALVAALAGLTTLWMARPAVKQEFDYRKRVATRRSQVVIAALFVLVYSSGLNKSGLWKHAGTVLLAREEAGRDAKLREIAYRPSPTPRPAARK